MLAYVTYRPHVILYNFHSCFALIHFNIIWINRKKSHLSLSLKRFHFVFNLNISRLTANTNCLPAQSLMKFSTLCIFCFVFITQTCRKCVDLWHSNNTQYSKIMWQQLLWTNEILYLLNSHVYDTFVDLTLQCVGDWILFPMKSIVDLEKPAL